MTVRAWGRAVLVVAPLLGAILPGRLAAMQDPVSPHGKLSNRVDCSACHTGSAWTPTRDPLDFDHDRQTGFALEGAHAEAECSTCHLSLRFDEPNGPRGSRIPYGLYPVS